MPRARKAPPRRCMPSLVVAGQSVAEADEPEAPMATPQRDEAKAGKQCRRNPACTRPDRHAGKCKLTNTSAAETAAVKQEEEENGVEDEEEYEVEKVLDKRGTGAAVAQCQACQGKHRGHTCGKTVAYLVKWKGHVETTWEPAELLKGCKALVAEYEASVEPSPPSPRVKSPPPPAVVRILAARRRAAAESANNRAGAEPAPPPAAAASADNCDINDCPLERLLAVVSAATAELVVQARPVGPPPASESDSSHSSFPHHAIVAAAAHIIPLVRMIERIPRETRQNDSLDVHVAAR